MFHASFPSFLMCLGVAAASDGGTPATTAAGGASVIPEPVRMKTLPGVFVISPETTVVASGPAAVEAQKLIDCLAPAMGFRLPLAEGNAPHSNVIALQIDDLHAELGDEGYRLDVAPERIVIRAATPAGLFYGAQSVRQLLPAAIFRKAAVRGVRWTVPCVSITDSPRFAWRGLLLDTARHFMPKSFVLKLLDVMALHKLNSLQLHLTDDQGWRIEIRKYPKLTEIGAWRDETLIGHPREKPWKFDGRRHGGFYTQDDIREIVRYAADRHINVVPEIEMPGHARAAIAAYPELGCHPDKPVRPWTVWGVCPDIFAPTDRTIAFLQDVLTEVMELFPSPYIHVGGDEAIKDQWKASPAVQARIRELGLKDEAEMQSWFIRQMDTFLTKHGRRLAGWDEILEGGLAPGAVVMSWRGEQGGITAARAGHDVVMAPTTHTYFDYCQGPREKEPLAIGGDLPLEKVYQYEPIPGVLSGEEAKHILGSQGQLWAEYMPDTRHVEYMAFPRAAALAEILWSPKQQRDYGRFLDRLRADLRRLDALDVYYRPLDSR
ncbi:MAG: beta-N-acetylhexosaminidase [Phycisphaerae bacterium]